MQKLKIDPEFRDKIPAMTEEQFSGLREDILRDGYVRDPLVVWKEENTLLDGHHRWKVICENWGALEDKFSIDYKSFDNRWAALEWICRNQLNKHNLNDEQITYITGEMFKARKKSVGAQVGNKNAEKQIAQNEPTVSGGTAAAIAKELGVGRETVKRAEKFHDGIDAIREVSKEAADKVMAGGSGATKQDVKDFPTMPQEEKSKFVSAVLSGEKKKERGKSQSRSKESSTSEIDAIIAEMYDTTTRPVFTIEMLLEDIEANGANYVDMLRNTLTDRSTLLTQENKPLVAAEIQKIIDKIYKLKELVEK